MNIEFSILKSIKYAQHHIRVICPRPFCPSASMHVFNNLTVIPQPIGIMLDYSIFVHKFRTETKSISNGLTKQTSKHSIFQIAIFHCQYH